MSSFFRRFKEEGGWTRVWTSLAMAIALAGGGIIYTQIQSGGGPAASGQIWVDTTPGSCTRTSGNYVDAQSCGTFDAAYELATCGEVVYIRGGTYSPQTISGSKSCTNTWTMGATQGVTCTSCVDMQVAAGETVNMSSGEVNATDLIMEKGSGTAFNIRYDGFEVCTVGSDLIFKDITWGGQWLINCATANTFSNVAIVGGSFANFNVGNPNFGCTQPCTGNLAIYAQTCPVCGGTDVTLVTNFVVDGVTFSNIHTPGFATDPGNNHSGLIRIDGGYDGVWIRNTNQYDQIEVTTSQVQTTNCSGPCSGGSGSAIDPKNVTITNNYFGSPQIASRAVNFNSVLANCTNYRLTYNTVINTNLYLFGCPSETGTITAGNYSPWAVGADCFGTHLKNAWYGGSGSGCGSDTSTSGAAGLGGTSGFDIQAGSFAIRAGEQANCPATDHNGTTRPSPAATNCDAGAYESGS